MGLGIKVGRLFFLNDGVYEVVEESNGQVEQTSAALTASALIDGLTEDVVLLREKRVFERRGNKKSAH